MPDSDRTWEADWEGSRRAQREAIARATPAQRLAWLEEALELAYAAGALGQDSVAAPHAVKEGGPAAQWARGSSGKKHKGKGDK
jgi:hypothetical protein